MPSVSARELFWHDIWARRYLERFCYSLCCTLKTFTAVCLGKKVSAYGINGASKSVIPKWKSGSVCSRLSMFALVDFSGGFYSVVAFNVLKRCRMKAAEKTAVRKLQIMVGMVTKKIPGWDLLFTHTTLGKVKPCGFSVKCFNMTLFGVTQDTGYLGFISGQNTRDLTWHFFVSLLYLNCAEMSTDRRLNVGKSLKKIIFCSISGCHGKCFSPPNYLLFKFLMLLKEESFWACSKA